jgi:large subunit ribosomal protein L23
MFEEYKLIRRPIVTEKSSDMKEFFNQVVFEVHPDANKSEIKKAVEKLFKVRVLEVHTQNRQGKPKRLGRFTGRRRAWKKAIVTLRQGDRVEFFEGV